MKKSELRKTYKSLRKQLSKTQVEDFSLAIANKVLQLNIWDASFYHLFLPIETQNEVNTEYILNILSGKDKNIVISKSNFETLTMENYLLTDATTIKTNSYGIPEPVDGILIQNSQIEVVFIPLLAYDKKGNRIGYGKGFYDRFLAECKPSVIKIGLSFFEVENTIFKVDKTDITLDYCVTPKGSIAF